MIFAISVVGASILVSTAPAQEDCSEIEVTAVVLASGIGPGQDLEIDLLHLFPVWQITNPSDEELYEAVDSLYVDDPHYIIYDQTWTNTVGNFRLYWSMPMDFGTSTIIDWRNACAVFAGTVVWAGQGHVVLPDSSSHDFGALMPNPAPAPSSLEILPNGFWGDSAGTPVEIADEVMGELRQTDLLHSFAECGEYSVVAFIYTPSVYITDPAVAQAVILINGYLPPPWGPVVSDVPLDYTGYRLTSYPNPFNPQTTISYELPEPAPVTLRIFDLTGRLVDVLVEGESQPAGTHSATWTGRDSRGRAMESGMYFYRLETGRYVETKRMTLIR